MLWNSISEQFFKVAIWQEVPELENSLGNNYEKYQGFGATKSTLLQAVQPVQQESLV